MTDKIQYGFCWYQPDQWERLKDISDDRRDLEDSYDEWRENASKAISEFESNGESIKKVNINLEELLIWCNEKDILVNSKARSEYVTYVMQQRKKS